jgi:adenylyltransferase/sulfurtransferase
MIEDIYHRQTLFPPIGREGQERIRGGTVFLAGCGAVGSTIAAHLVRCGIGRLVFCDRDIVELTNLPRQSLFEREDALKGLPKVEAARKRLERINPDVVLEPHAVDLVPENIEGLLLGADCIADGSDNAELRFLINDAALKHGIPWIYTGVIADSGHNMTITAIGRPCLRCYLRDPPPAGALPTCASAGVIGPAVGIMGSMAAAETLRILTGYPGANAGRLTITSAWKNSWRRVIVDADPDCPACVSGRFEFLEEKAAPRETVLCGSDSVLIPAPAGHLGCTLDDLGRKLSVTGTVEVGRFHVRFTVPPLSMTVFSDGRTIVSGTTDPAQARAFRDRYL